MQISSNLHSNVSRSTRIKSSSVHTYIFVCFTLRVILQGFVTQNATWCQNRGCICISLTRRTYGRIHSSFLHPAYIRTIILWTELFPKKRREKIQGEILQSIFEYSGVSTFLQELQEYSVFYSVSTRNPATPSNSAYRINSSPRNTTTTRLIPCRSVQGIFQQLFPVSPSILHGRIQHSKRSIHKQASSNSTRQKQHSTRQPASTQSLQ